MKHLILSLHPDKIGFYTSILCAIHCATLPFLLSLAPLAGLHFLASPWTEIAVLCLSLLLALFSLLKGYYKYHRRKMALVVVIMGFLLIGTGHFGEGEWHEIIFSALGACFIAVAHLLNRKHIQEAARQVENQTVSHKQTRN